MVSSQIESSGAQSQSRRSRRCDRRVSRGDRRRRSERDRMRSSRGERLAQNARPRARPRPLARRRHCPPARRRDRANAHPRRRQDPQRGQGRSHERHLALGVLRRRGVSHARQNSALGSARYFHLYSSQSAGCRRTDRAVEFSLGDSRLEIRAGIGRPATASFSNPRN